MASLPHRRHGRNLGMDRSHDHDRPCPITITLDMGTDQLQVVRMDTSFLPGAIRAYRCHHPVSDRTFRVVQDADLETSCDCGLHRSYGDCFHTRALTRAGLLIEVEIFDLIVDATTLDVHPEATFELAGIGEAD